MKFISNLEFYKNVVFKQEENDALIKVLILLNTDPLDALKAYRIAVKDETQFSNYETMLKGNERSMAIKNMLNIIVERIANNVKVLKSMTVSDSDETKKKLKSILETSKFSSVHKGMSKLYTELDNVNSLSIVNSLRNNGSIKLADRAQWFKTNSEVIDDVIDFDFISFSNNLNMVTNGYLENTIKNIDDGLVIEVDFNSEDNSESFIFTDDTNSLTLVENIRFLEENSFKIEAGMEVSIKELLSNIKNYKPDDKSMSKLLDKYLEVINSYATSSISTDYLNEMTKNYNNAILTYFNIFSLSLGTLEDYTNALQSIVSNLNSSVNEIKLLQNYLK